MRWILILTVSLTGCGLLPERWGGPPAKGVTETRTGVTTDVITRPQARPAVPPGTQAGPGGTTAQVGGTLGRTVATLGDASEPGLWLKTPLVQSEGPGRIADPATGKSLAVNLFPIAGPVTAGSRVSLQAMLALGLQLTDIVDLDVSLGG